MEQETQADKERRMREYGQIPLSAPVQLTLTEVPGIPAGANPFHHDHFNMGTNLVRGWMVMHEGFGSPDWPTSLGYMILVNTNTGQRFHIKVDEKTDVRGVPDLKLAREYTMDDAPAHYSSEEAQAWAAGANSVKKPVAPAAG